MTTKQEFDAFIQAALNHEGEEPITDKADGRINYWNRPGNLEKVAPVLNPRAERLIENSGADIHFQGEDAVTDISDMTVFVPDRLYFRDAGTFYAVTFHELGHWTGSRIQPEWMEGSTSFVAVLIRMQFGEYPPEEIIASATSFFVNQKLGTLDDKCKEQIFRFTSRRLNDMKARLLMENQETKDYIYGLVRDRVDYLMKFDKAQPSRYQDTSNEIFA